jgi:hypothetical protein
MELFAQDSFLGGLNTRLEPSKLPVESYPLLINGRITRNTVKPVKNHLLIDSPAGNKQGLYALGSSLIVFVDGAPYYRDILSATPTWTPIAGWSPALSASTRIYAELIPVSYYQGSITYDSTTPDIGNVNKTFPGIALPTLAQLFVTDGISQPRIIFADGTWRLTQVYSQWTTANPEYVPLCVLPKRSQGKLYAVDPVNRNKIYHSVSGRFLDFVIQRDDTGDKAGDADTTFKSVDYNPATALLPLSDGGLFAGTLYSSYAITPDYSDTFFGEPFLPEDRLFPTGPINERSFADVNGDTAFITQTGIQSFNVTKQTQTESNNFPLGAPIADLLNGTQVNTAACNFDVFALFAVNTVYGKAVLVYDATLNSFVSLDTGFGEVVDFAVVKANGVQKLFFTNTDNEIYEAYGSALTAVCRIYLGDFATKEPSTGEQIAGKFHRATLARLQFGDVKEDTNVQIGLYTDRKQIGVQSRSIIKQVYPEVIPLPLPYVANRQCQLVAAKFADAPYGWKSGVFVEWQGEAQLYAGSLAGDTQSMDNAQMLDKMDAVQKVVTVFSDAKLFAVANTAVMTLVTGLTVGEYYSVSGICHNGGQVIENGIFKALGSEVNLNGSLRSLGILRDTYLAMTALKPALIVGCGDYVYDSGTQIEAVHPANLFKYPNLIWAAGNHDLDTDSGKWFWRIRDQKRYFKYSLNSLVDFFILNSGRRTDNTVAEPDGENIYSVQANWLKYELGNSTAAHKIICFHHPPYTEDTNYYPGYTTLRWPFAEWGASMVISGHAHAYQRFDIDNIPYIVLPPSSADTRAFKAGVNTAIARFSATGFLKLTVDGFNISCELISTATGDPLDGFGLYA